MRSSTSAAVLALVSLSACAQWGTAATYGQRREVGRRLLGAPQVAQTSSSNLSAGFQGATASNASGTRSATVAGLSGSTDSMTRTHCIQEAEIEYEQPYQLVAQVEKRPLDVAGGVALGAFGLLIMATASARSDTIFEPGDPLYEEPPSATPGLLVGGAMVVGGAGWIWHSYAHLPKGPPPATQQQVRRWTSREFVESTGCGLVPADQPGVTPVPTPTPATGDLATRLRELEQLRASGLVTEQEYQAKRKALLDQL
jgi:Short C-terminal domain